jgi:hypothetical protein
MPVNTDHLKQRINEVLEAKSELNRLTSKPYAKLSLEGKYAIRYHYNSARRSPRKHMPAHRNYDSIKNNFKVVDKFLRSVREKYAINL